MQLKDILFPTDFSTASEAAGRIARDMARQAGSKLHVVHVVPPVTDPADSAERLTGVARMLGEGVSLATALLSGRPARQIVDYARQKGIGLIVLGTHGRTGVSRAILGSVAEGVVRLAPCLVLTVPPTVLEAERTAQPARAAAAAVHRCLVCGRDIESDELICEACRTKIRAEVLEQKIQAERPGHRGSPA